MAYKTTINAHIKRQLNIFIRALQSAGIPYSHVYLFGSHARGTAEKDSDIDLCVISNSFGKDYHADMMKLLSASRTLDVPIDVIPYHPKDFSYRYDPLAQEIKRYGILYE